ncbi:VOC family protein [Nonomuraea dietziae]|uniref:VOC family protein n=1 Tax=Nonomuraea dietziae TaxID=65515 RepID=UPI0033FA522F
MNAPGTPPDIDYIDHTVLITTDLAATSARYEALGFTLSPTSPHLLAERPGEPPMPTCTANRCAYFGQSFIELLGIVDPAAPDPWGVHHLRETYRGLLMADGIGGQRVAASGLQRVADHLGDRDDVDAFAGELRAERHDLGHSAAACSSTASCARAWSPRGHRTARVVMPSCA